MKIASTIAGVVAFLGVVLFTILLCLGHIGATAFVTLMLALGLFCLALHGFSRLRELDLKQLKITLDRIEQVKSEIEEMYGGIDHIRRSTYAMSPEKLSALGSGGILSDLSMPYIAGVILRERERLAKIFIKEKTPEKIAEAILDGSFNDKVFKWAGPGTPLDVPPKSVQERKNEKKSG
jgi:hypothetical protein